MGKAPISRKEFLLHLLRSPAGYIILGALGTSLAYLLWQERIEILNIAEVIALACVFVFLAGILPMALGFALQFFMRRPVADLVLWLLTALLAGIDSIFHITHISLSADAPGWAPWFFMAARFLVLVSFPRTGAAACRRWLPQRLSRNEIST